MSGLINYYGRTPESDNILVKPVLLQKGNTKLALYGMSNVRDERLFRTFRDGNVKFFQPATQKGDWFSLMSVHQNHHAYTETGYLPEHFLPDFLDLVVWGHEHECLIDPKTNPETNFRVMQPGSSVATSLVPGEAIPKHVAIVSITGKDFNVENIRLKTVRPFMYKDISLSSDRTMREISQEPNNSSKVHAYLIEIVEKLIAQAKEEWLDLQHQSGDEPDEDLNPPLPLIRLRVDYTPPEGGTYTIDNPQRFSNRFMGSVANTADVVQYHRKRTAPARANKNQPDMPDEGIMAALSLENVKVEKLVEEFLTAQSLSILPQNPFSDAVGQFVDKDDKHAMQEFVDRSLTHYVKDLVAAGGEDEIDEDVIAEKMEQIKESLETAFVRGELPRGKGGRKPKPSGWDSEMDGPWEDNPAAIIRVEEEMSDGGEEGDEERVGPKRGTTKGRGARTAGGTTRKTGAAAAKKTAPARSTGGRSKKKPVSEDEEDEDEDVIMLDDDDEEDEDENLFVTQSKKPSQKAPASTTRPTKAPPKPATARGGKASVASSSAKQTRLSFSSQANGTGSRATGGRAAAPTRLQEPSDDEISDDDAFEPPPAAATRARTARH